MTEQPMPIEVPESRPVEVQFNYRPEDTIQAERIHALLKERIQKGVETYGTVLKTHNGRNALQDAKEELADAVLYLTQAMMEAEDAKDEKRQTLSRMVRTFVLSALADIISEELFND